MTTMTRFLAAAAAVGGLAPPAAAQYQQPYPQQGYPQQYQQYPQSYPQSGYPQSGYPQSGYGYPGTTGNPVTDIIDQLLGNQYNVTDRQAVRQCANAARAQAAQQYGGYGYNNGYGYGNNGYNNNAYGQGYNNHGYGNYRVTAITDVQRRSSGLRVKGLMSAGYQGQYGNQYGNQYGTQYGYQNNGYGRGQLSFRCNVDYRGAVTNLRIERADDYYRR